MAFGNGPYALWAALLWSFVLYVGVRFRSTFYEEGGFGRIEFVARSGGS